MSKAPNIKNPSNVRLQEVTGYVTTLGAQDAASGNPNDTSWFVFVGGIDLTTRNRDYFELFSLSVRVHWQVSVVYNDGKDVFFVRMDQELR